MDWRFSVGILIGLIGMGVGLMGIVSPEVGRVFLIAAGIWFALFVNPKSPIKKKYWANSKLSIAIDGQPNFNRLERKLKAYMDIVALSEVDIESVYLEFDGRPLPSDWDSNSKPYWDERGKAGHDCVEICFNIPDEVLNGEYTAHLIAVTKDGRSKSPSFKVKISR